MLLKCPFLSIKGVSFLLFVPLYALCRPFQRWIFGTELGRDFVVTISATVLGVMLGIPVGLAVERYKSDWDKAEERGYLLSSIDQALATNMDLVDKLATDLRPDRIVHYNVDPFFLAATAEVRYRIIDDLQLNKEIEAIRAELDTIRHMITAQFDLGYGIESRTTNGSELRALLLDAIQKRLSKLRELIGKARARIASKGKG